MRAASRTAVARVLDTALALGLAAVVMLAMLALPEPAIDLRREVAGQLGASGVAHPVTAVLLNFRGYDTLLEIGVLLLAVLGVLAMHLAAGDTGLARRPDPDPVLQALLPITVPLALLAAGYLYWAGGHAAGGAFQAGALLGAAGVLLRLAGRLPALLPPGFLLRAALLVGFAVFLAVALGVTGGGLAFLEYPLHAAHGLIVLIEATLTLSIGLILLALFIGAPRPGSTGGGPK